MFNSTYPWACLLPSILGQEFLSQIYFYFTSLGHFDNTIFSIEAFCHLKKQPRTLYRHVSGFLFSPTSGTDLFIQVPVSSLCDYL